LEDGREALNPETPAKSSSDSFCKLSTFTFSIPLEKYELETNLFRVHCEGTFTFAIRAVADFDFLRRVLVERTQDSATLPAVKFDILELREYTRSPGHNTRHTDKVIEVGTTQVTERRTQWQVGDADVDFRVNTLVRGIVYEYRVEGNLVEDSKHG
jgi:hypothetical protein